MKLFLAVFITAASLNAHAIARCSFEANKLGTAKEFNAFLKRLQKAKTAHQLGGYATYPLKINTKPKRTVVKNRNQLKSMNKLVMTPKVKKALASAKLRFIYCNQEGAMIGKGQIWVRRIQKQYRIVSINP